MKRILAAALIVATLASCDKDKFETVPQIDIKEFGPNEVVKGQLIELRAIVSDKEGDIQDSLYLIKKRFNASTNFELTSDTIRYYIGTLGAPIRQENEVLIRLLYGEQRPEIAPIQNLESVDRGFRLGLIVVDKEGNRSPYVESDRIVLKAL
jgi:hypothetical protein